MQQIGPWEKARFSVSGGYFIQTDGFQLVGWEWAEETSPSLGEVLIELMCACRGCACSPSSPLQVGEILSLPWSVLVAVGQLEANADRVVVKRWMLDLFSNQLVVTEAIYNQLLKKVRLKFDAQWMWRLQYGINYQVAQVQCLFEDYEGGM